MSGTTALQSSHIHPNPNLSHTLSLLLTLSLRCEIYFCVIQYREAAAAVVQKYAAVLEI